VTLNTRVSRWTEWNALLLSIARSRAVTTVYTSRFSTTTTGHHARRYTSSASERASEIPRERISRSSGLENVVTQSTESAVPLLSSPCSFPSTPSPTSTDRSSTSSAAFLVKGVREASAIMRIRTRKSHVYITHTRALSLYLSLSFSLSLSLLLYFCLSFPSIFRRKNTEKSPEKDE